MSSDFFLPIDLCIHLILLFQEFFEERKNDAAERERLNSSRLVFFLHLLGLDTNGHGNKPHSKEYLDNIEGSSNKYFLLRFGVASPMKSLF